MSIKQSYFETLNAALESENLVDKWKLGLNISYGQTVRMISEDGHLISIYRSDTGRYERPVWYKV
jgi:hypothetical protein